MTTFLAIAVVVWTLVAWGGRIGLLTDGEPATWDWLRIGGSIVIGLAAGAALYFSEPGAFRSLVLYVFGVWTVVIWGRSMVINWMGSGSLPFKLVHTALAIGFFLLAWLAVSAAGGDPISGPDEADGQQQGDGEPTRLT